MLDQILNTVKEQVSGKLIEQAGLSREQASKSVEIAGKSVVNVVQEEAASGNTENIMDLFSKGTAASSNPIMDKIGTAFITKLSSSLNITGSTASSIKNMVLPVLIKTLSSKFQSSDAGGISGLLGMLGGGGSLNASGIKNKLGKFFK